MAEDKKTHSPAQDQRIEKREITEELKDSYLDYAMSVIVARALPDVRDGLKPVHRRILWSMWESGQTHSAKMKKCANVVGDVLGKYHPNGDQSVYDALVRMVQEFSLRYPLIEGQGNFGSIDADSAAAYRYTEARLARISDELLTDIEKETVDFQPNYDGARKEPKVLPAKIPNLLVNGSVGIAVGMATNIPPHNLGEVTDATIHLIDNPDADPEELTHFIQGPDFPTGGIIYDKKNIIASYAAGRGTITVRGVAEVKEKQRSYVIEITEIPYQVNKAELTIKIAELVTNKKIEGVRAVRDESNREGIRLLIELKNDVPPQRVVNQLYKFTDLQKDFHMNILALKDGLQPQVMSLKDVLLAFIEHRKSVITRRAQFDLKRAEERAHILEGLSKALSVIDKIIATIKKSESKEDAQKNLIRNFSLTAIQATAILEMKLQTLAALERKKIEDELKEKRELIKELQLLLKSPKKIIDVARRELKEVKEKYANPRRTKVIASGLKEFKEEDLIPQEKAIITLSQAGYIKRLPPGTFKIQNRGGKGLIGSDVAEEDFLNHFISGNTHDNILFFTDRGRVFQTKLYEIPEASRTSKGKPIHNFLEIPIEEKVSAIVSYDAKLEKNQQGLEFQRLVMVTKNGMIKKTSLGAFQNVRRTGIIAMKLKKGDLLRWVKMSSGDEDVMITTSLGKAIRFEEKKIRSMGRGASGVRGIRLGRGDEVSSLCLVGKKEASNGRLLVVMANGFGKQTALKEYKTQGRGGSGILTAKVTSKTGHVIAASIIDEETDILALSQKGQIIKTKIATIRSAGRATQGVKIMTLEKGDSVTGIICL